MAASKGEVPVKANYYRGIQYQSQSKWEEALRQYNTFRIKTEKVVQDKLNLAEKIQQCYNHENPYFSTGTVNNEGNETPAVPDSSLPTGADSIPAPETDSLQNNISEGDSLNIKRILSQECLLNS